MDDFGAEVAYPTIEQICNVNRRMIDEFGGIFYQPDNLRNRNSLEYILDVVTFPIYNTYIYSSLKEKAAAITHQIISRHIFHDGCKRTGTHVALEFLRSNGQSIKIDETIVELTVAIARGDAGYDELLEWLHQHQEI